MIRRLPLLLLLLVTWAAPSAAQVDVQPLPTLHPVLERVSPGVVNITVRATINLEDSPLFRDPLFRRFFDMPEGERERQSQSVGSGVIIDANNGYVVTNQHVIAHADEVTVVLNDRRSYSATVIGTDPETDIALLQIPAENLVQVPFGDMGSVQIGDFVIAIGNPFGLGQTATMGIIGAMGRSGLGIDGYENFIQTDASINPGNSGGALVDQFGRLVGINTAIISRTGGNQGIGFATPVHMVRFVVGQLIEHGEVSRGELGVMVQELTPELAQAFDVETLRGALIADVNEGSAAAEAGLRPGDVIVGLDGQPVESSSQLRTRIGLRQPDDRITLHVLREGSQMDIVAELQEKPRPPADEVGLRADGPLASPVATDSAINPLEGLTLSPVPEDLPVPDDVEGVMVVEVEPGSPADRAGLEPGDIISQVGSAAVRDTDDVERLAEESSRRPVLLRVRRGPANIFLAAS